MPRAIWKDTVIAQSDEVRTASGYTYFPRESVRQDLLQSTQTHTTCSWKGEASYYDVVVDGEVNHDAAWTYPRTSEAARHIEGWIGFWRGVRIEP